jgi:hypothetical protein
MYLSGSFREGTRLVQHPSDEVGRILWLVYEKKLNVGPLRQTVLEEKARARGVTCVSRNDHARNPRPPDEIRDRASLPDRVITQRREALHSIEVTSTSLIGKGTIGIRLEVSGNV